MIVYIDVRKSRRIYIKLSVSHYLDRGRSWKNEELLCFTQFLYCLNGFQTQSCFRQVNIFFLYFMLWNNSNTRKNRKNSTINSMYPWPRASLVAQTVKNLPVMQETGIWSLQEDPIFIYVCILVFQYMYHLKTEHKRPRNFEEKGKTNIAKC